MLGNKVWCDSVEGWYIMVWFCRRLVHCGVILLKLEKKGDRWQLFRAVTAVEEEEEEEEKEKEEKKKEEKEKKQKEEGKNIKLLLIDFRKVSPSHTPPGAIV